MASVHARKSKCGKLETRAYIHAIGLCQRGPNNVVHAQRADANGTRWAGGRSRLEGGM
jgi:hypothetical protein